MEEKTYDEEIINETTATEEIKNEEAVNEEGKINPDDIIFDDEEADMAMPEPETHDYNKDAADGKENLRLKMSPLFTYMFEYCVGKMPYNSVLVNGKKENIKLVDLMKFVQANSDKEIMVKDMDTILSFISTCPMNIIKPLMEIIETQQNLLWTIIK